MKTIFGIIMVFAVVGLWLGCQSKEIKDNHTAVEKAEEVALVAKRTEDNELKRKSIAQETIKKNRQREVARAEKARVAATYKDASGKLVYNKAEIDPSYVGGNEEMRKFLKANLVFPEAARKKGYEGTVFVDFIVDEKGRVREVFATDVVGEDVDFSLKEESVRVVASMPLWSPGMQHGEAVDATFSIPISFEMN